MSNPYGRKERITLIWEDACKSSKVKVLKGKRVVEGSPKHCAEESIRWLEKKGFIDPVGILTLAGKMDFALFGTVWRKVEEQKNHKF